MGLGSPFPLAGDGGGDSVAESGPGGAAAGGSGWDTTGEGVAGEREGGPKMGSRDWPREAFTRAVYVGG